MPERIPKVLYHYCSVQTFYNIILTNSLWLSDISKSNDSQELKWIKGQCESYILKAWDDFVRTKEEAGHLQAVDFQSFSNTYEYIKKLIKTDTSKCWVFCLSEKCDNLGQWRGYGDDGRGVSSGFKKELFQMAHALAHEDNCEEDIYFHKVHYTQDEVREFFEINAGLGGIQITDTSDDVIAKIQEAINLVMGNLPFFKPEAFKEEREWRICYSMDTAKLARGKIPFLSYTAPRYGDIISLQNYGFIPKNGMLVSHVELIVPNLVKFIDTITIGPKSPLTEEDVQLFLIHAGFLQNGSDSSIKIEKSTAPYR